MQENSVLALSDAELEQLTIDELSALKVDIENAIRARIRAKQQAKLPQPIAPKQPVNDLESARDAWLSSRRQRSAG